MLGICGTGMGALATLLKESGYRVSGSDTAFYPPMGDQLRDQEIELYKGYSSDNLAQKPDYVVIGNVIPKSNPEAVAVLEQDIPYGSMPQAINQFFLKDKTPLVVAGTHGKTTTSTLLAWVLSSAGRDPSFLIGGVSLNFNRSSHLGNGKYFILEGDEYDTAFFDKQPKFVHYKPEAAILTSIEWDHVDIYPTFDHVIKAFEKFIGTLRTDSTLLACENNVTIDGLCKKQLLMSNVTACIRETIPFLP